MEVALHDIESLAAKLNSLDLTPGERTALGALLTDAADAEVEGYGKAIYVGNLPVIQGFNIGMPPRLKILEGD